MTTDLIMRVNVRTTTTTTTIQSGGGNIEGSRRLFRLAEDCVDPPTTQRHEDGVKHL